MNYKKFINSFLKLSEIIEKYCSSKVESNLIVLLFNQYVVQLWYDALSIVFPLSIITFFNSLDFPAYSLLVNEYQSAFYSNSFEVYDNDFVLFCLRGICLFLLPFLSPFSPPRPRICNTNAEATKGPFCVWLYIDMV